MAEDRRSKKRKLRELLQDLLEGSSDSEISGGSQPSDDDDPEMNCPIATLAEGQKVQPINGLLALLEKKTPENSGPDVHPDISDLLTTFLTKGLDSEGRKNTMEQYPPLKGCTALNPPEMNAEIKPCLTHATLRQDMFLKKLQNQLAAVVSALAVPLNTLYEKIKTTDSPSPHEEVEKLGDPLKLVADVFYSISNHRRYLIAPALDDSVKDVLETCPIDSLLFGQNFTEKLKSSTEAKKFGASIKKKYKIARSGPASSKAFRPSPSSKQVAGSSKPGSHFFPYRQRLPKTRYRKEEEEKHRPRKRPYQH